MKKILTVVGTRPNFIKVTRFKKAAREQGNVDLRIVHTGQHYDDRMSRIFFQQFGLEPDHALGVKRGSSNAQMAGTMLGLERLMLEEFHPDLVLVVGDVNATLAAALTSERMGIPIGHVESGLRSFDRSMPEEVNRVLTDELAREFFITEQSGWDHLCEEGRATEHLHFVGNTMIDTLLAYEGEIDKSKVLEELGLREKAFALMTIHRPSTVDHEEGLLKLLELIRFIAEGQKLLFPLHPRTKKNLEEFGLYARFQRIPGLILTEPMDYFGFQKLIKASAFVLTDSGGIQEETTFRRVPCLTLRPNTERPSTVRLGTNTLLPFETDQLKEYIEAIGNGTYKKGEVPPYWDGKASERIFKVLAESE
ncbi:MAG: non-hydrolyzing UDP-N-acetylglucosamine 2-epimerase [Flavobacteriales bacterium]